MELYSDPIDVVITWVDGNDRSHIDKKNEWLKKESGDLPENAVADYRWEQSDEILHCLKSIELNAGWVRYIWIVTDQQKPNLEVFDSSFLEKIKLVDHKEIFRGFNECLPTFNSISIESVMWRIDGLAENFIYFNDDIFLLRPVKKRQFFRLGKPVLRGRWKSETITDDMKLAHKNKIHAAEMLGYSSKNFFSQAHVASPLQVSVCERLFERFEQEFLSNISHRFRSEGQFTLVALYNHFVIGKGECYFRKNKDWVVFPSNVLEAGGKGEVERKVRELFDAKNRFACVNNYKDVVAINDDFDNILSQAIGEKAGLYKSYLNASAWTERVVEKVRKKIANKLSLRKIIKNFVSTTPGGAVSRKGKRATGYIRETATNSYDAIDLYRKRACDHMHNEKINEIRQRLHPCQDGKLRVVFVVNQAAKWNCQSIFDYMRNEKGWDVKVAVTLVPFALKLDKLERARQYRKEFDFYSKIDSQPLAFYEETTDTELPIEELQADVVFLQQPWGMRDYPRRLAGRALTCYTHYGFIMMRNHGMHYNIASFHSYLWRYFSQTEIHKRIQIKYDPSSFDRVMVTGYPKLDVYLEVDGGGVNKSNIGNPAKVIYAPHHSFSKRSLGMATFKWSAQTLIDISADYPGIDWIYKPHPKLEYEVVKHGLMGKKEYAEFLQNWYEVGEIASEGDYFHYFMSSSALITDCGSFLAEYLPTTKPIIFMKSKNTIGFNGFGSYLAESFYVVNNEKELIETFKSVVIDGDDPLYDLRVERIRSLFPAPGGDSGKMISDYIDNLLMKN